MEFCPGIYEHAAALIGRGPWEVSRSNRLLADAHREAWRLYGHRMVVVGVDVYNIEPEALGAVVGEPAGDGVPAIVQHPFEEMGEIAGTCHFDPQAGRFGVILEAAAELAATCVGAEVRVPLCGPMALASGLLGMENLLMGLMDDLDIARESLNSILGHQSGYLRAIRAAGARPIFFESGATPPLLPVSMFEEFEAPLLRQLFDDAAGIFGERPPCIIGGDAAPIARAFLESGPGYVIAPSETDQKDFVASACSHPTIHVRINVPSTRLVSSGWDALWGDASGAMALAARRENTSVGCGVVPFETDPGLLLRLRDAIRKVANSAP